MLGLLGPAKGKDSATSLGPWLVTPDELAPRRAGNAYDLEMTASVNGHRWSTGNMSTIYWSFGQLLAYASRGTELRPGDIIGSGTVGTGCILELSRVHGSEAYPWLAPGDKVESRGHWPRRYRCLSDPRSVGRPPTLERDHTRPGRIEYV